MHSPRESLPIQIGCLVSQGPTCLCVAENIRALCKEPSDGMWRPTEIMDLRSFSKNLQATGFPLKTQTPLGPTFTTNCHADSPVQEPAIDHIQSGREGAFSVSLQWDIRWFESAVKAGLKRE